MTTQILFYVDRTKNWDGEGKRRFPWTVFTYFTELHGNLNLNAAWQNKLYFEYLPAWESISGPYSAINPWFESNVSPPTSEKKTAKCNNVVITHKELANLLILESINIQISKERIHTFRYRNYIFHQPVKQVTHSKVLKSNTTFHHGVWLHDSNFCIMNPSFDVFNLYYITNKSQDKDNAVTWRKRRRSKLK